MVPDHDAHPVAVRVSAQDEVHVILPGQVDGQIEALRVLRVGGDHGGEVAVDHHLLGLTDQVLDAQGPQCLRHQLVAAAVEGSVHQLEGVRHLGHGFLVVNHGSDVGHKLSVRLFPHGLNEAGLHRLVEVHAPDAIEDVDLFQSSGDGVGVVRGQLGAVLPVDLVAIVLLRIVAGGDVDARLAAVLPHGEAQLRRGAEGLEDPHMDTVGGADLRRRPGELHGVVPAVHTDSHAPALALLALGADDLGKALGGPADHMDVHVVQAHGHDAPQAGGAELQRAVEPALNLLGVISDALQLRTLRVGQGRTRQPLFIFLHKIHARDTSCCVN